VDVTGWKNRAGLLALLVAPPVGCAKIHTQTQTQIHRHPTEPVRKAMVLGSRGDQVGHRITSRRYGASWVQYGAVVEIRLSQWQTCQVVERIPVIREVRTIRTADAGLIWEYGISGLGAGFAAAAFTSPRSFSSAALDEYGQLHRDPGPGYRVGTLFAVIGAIALVAAVHDTFQTRDSIEATETFVLKSGAEVACVPEQLGAGGHAVELAFGRYRQALMTDAEGRVVVTLPAEAVLLEAMGATAEGPQTDKKDVVTHELTDESAPSSPAIARQVVHGSLRVGNYAAVAIDILVPFDQTQGHPRELRAVPKGIDRRHSN